MRDHSSGSAIRRLMVLLQLLNTSVNLRNPLLQSVLLTPKTRGLRYTSSTQDVGAWTRTAVKRKLKTIT